MSIEHQIDKQIIIFGKLNENQNHRLTKQKLGLFIILSLAQTIEIAANLRIYAASINRQNVCRVSILCVVFGFDVSAK